MENGLQAFFRFSSLRAMMIAYMAGTTTSVKTVVNVRPKMIVQASGFQKEALSPPQ
jgi:hypothetical protein